MIAMMYGLYLPQMKPIGQWPRNKYWNIVIDNTHNLQRSNNVQYSMQFDRLFLSKEGRLFTRINKWQSKLLSHGRNLIIVALFRKGGRRACHADLGNPHIIQLAYAVSFCYLLVRSRTLCWTKPVLWALFVSFLDAELMTMEKFPHGRGGPKGPTHSSNGMVKTSAASPPQEPSIDP